MPFSASKNFLKDFCSSLEYSFWFDPILNSLKTIFLQDQNDFCYKPILNNAEFTFIEKILNEWLLYICIYLVCKSLFCHTDLYISTVFCGPMLVLEPNVVWLLVTVLVMAVVFVTTTFASDCLLLSSPSVPTLCLKDPRREADAIQPDLLLKVR